MILSVLCHKEYLCSEDNGENNLAVVKAGLGSVCLDKKIISSRPNWLRLS